LPGDEIPVGRLVDLFIAAWGAGQWKDMSDPSQPHEARVLRLSIEKALYQLGWRPRWSVAEAVQKTALWYRRSCRNHDTAMLDACIKDIDCYEEGSPR
jgi:CDP-glucose 4,6-dehydratase